MKTSGPRTAIIVGASSGIGEALSRELSREGWRLGLLARRLDRLEALAEELGAGTTVRRLDVGQADAAEILERFICDLGGADLVVISAGTGHLNRQLNPEPDVDTVSVNVLGFMTASQVAMRHFLARGTGHLVGISSIAALRGSAEGAAYSATKAFQSIYLDGLRDLARRSMLPITVTEIQPGAVDTAMLKTERPLPYLVRRFFVATDTTAAKQIMRAIRNHRKHAYVTKRYAVIAWLARLLPRPG